MGKWNICLRTDKSESNDSSLCCLLSVQIQHQNSKFPMKRVLQENLGYEYTTEDPHYAPQYDPNAYYDPNVHGTMADTYQLSSPNPHNYYNMYSGYSADPQQRYSTADSSTGGGAYPGVYPGYHPMPENQVGIPYFIMELSNSVFR